MFTLMSNRGSQMGCLHETKAEAQKEADDFNGRGLDVFVWVIEAPVDVEFEDMPGRGMIYG